MAVQMKPIHGTASEYPSHIWPRGCVHDTYAADYKVYNRMVKSEQVGTLWQLNANVPGAHPSKQDQHAVIQFFGAEGCQVGDIHGRMCTVYGNMYHHQQRASWHAHEGCHVARQCPSPMWPALFKTSCAPWVGR